LIRGETIECNQCPPDVVGSFVGKEVANQISAASSNNATPVLGILSECISLERIDLVANDADNHCCSPVAPFTGINSDGNEAGGSRHCLHKVTAIDQYPCKFF